MTSLPSDFKLIIAGIIRGIIQSGIPSDSRATEDDNSPSVLLTIGATQAEGLIRFGIQTGDNSFMGNSYGHEACAVVSIYPFSNPMGLAEEIDNEIDEQFSMLSL